MNRQLLERCRDKLAALPFGDDKPATVKQLLADLDAAIAQQAEPVALTDEQIIARCAAAGIAWIAPDVEPDDYPGGFDMSSMTDMRRLLQTAPPPATSGMPDERAAFEAWGAEYFNYGFRPQTWVEQSIPENSEYGHEGTQMAWEGWKARAALQTRGKNDSGVV